MTSPTIHQVHARACYEAHPVTPGRCRLRALPHLPPPSGAGDPRPPDDPVGAALRLLALAVDVGAGEVAHLLARPTPSARRAGPLVRFVGPPAA